MSDQPCSLFFLEPSLVFGVCDPPCEETADGPNKFPDSQERICFPGGRPVPVCRRISFRRSPGCFRLQVFDPIQCNHDAAPLALRRFPQHEKRVAVGRCIITASLVPRDVVNVGGANRGRSTVYRQALFLSRKARCGSARWMAHRSADLLLSCRRSAYRKRGTDERRPGGSHRCGDAAWARMGRAASRRNFESRGGSGQYCQIRK